MGRNPLFVVPTPQPSSEPEAQNLDAWKQAAHMAELGVLTASLLHEIRQPLFAIKGYAQLGTVGKESVWFAKILDQIEHMEALIRHYGAFGGGSDPELELDLHTPVQAAIDMLSSRLRGKIELKYCFFPQVLLVHGRELALKQITVNLLQNAIDALEDQGGRIEVITNAVGDSVSLVVKDNGPGVPESLRARLFEPFVTSKPPGRGTGLGLYIAQRLVEELHGSLRLGNAEKGTLFEVTLPRCVADLESEEVGDLGFR